MLAGLPPSLALVFVVISPEHIATLLNDPLGVQMLMAAAIVLQVIGALIIRKIVNIEY